MKIDDVATWMQAQLEREGCLYQDDVVDFLVKNRLDDFLRENADGNLVVGRKLLNSFHKLNETAVVWVSPDKYWRWRVKEDEEGRNARG